MKYLLNSSTDGHRIWNGNMNPNVLLKQNTIQKTDNKYSSNNAINKYVIAMKEINQNISRTELARLPMEFRRPVFNSLNNNNKLNFL